MKPDFTDLLEASVRPSAIVEFTLRERAARENIPEITVLSMAL
jgi:hypothetical protein